MKKILFIFLLLFSVLNVCRAEPIYCFIGDSRFCGMREVVEQSEDVEWICEVGAGTELYREKREYLKSLPRTIIIVYALGVNEIFADVHLEILNDLVNNLCFDRVVFLSTLPVDESVIQEFGYNITNSEIENFNGIIREHLPYGVRYLDGYGYLVTSGFYAPDGLHYDAETYRCLYSYLMRLL